MSGIKHNSVETAQSDLIKNQELVIEILTKIDQAINSSESFVSVSGHDNRGNEVISQIPSFSYINSRMDQLSLMVRKISGFDGYPSTMHFDGNGKKLFAIDINEEPQKITGLERISTFKATPNWIFDSMMNPMINVELDLTDKISDNVKTIISKRFIVTFETFEYVDPDTGYRETRLTSKGTQRLNEFKDKYNGNNNIDLIEFIRWLDKDGLENKVNEYLIDEDHFTIEPLNIQYKGFFDILGTEIDVANNKLWYIFDTLDYFDLTDGFGNEKLMELKQGVQLAVNNENGTSATVYEVAEISTITSQFRVRLTRVFGEEPIPILQKGLRIHSKPINEKKVKISVGYDEYSVLFIKPLNTITHIQAVEWSSGLGFYTNELRKDDNTGDLLSDFYANKVLDYGLALDELTAKKIPTMYGIKPDAPNINAENFQVVQTNKHLTDTVEAERIRDLHNNKINLTSEISQIQNRIEKQNALIAKTNFSTEAEKKSAQKAVSKLTTDLRNKTKSKNTITSEILQNKKNINKIKPTYALRGIIPFPKAKTGKDTRKQEVVQFEIWYRKLSKSGDENQLQTFTNISKQIKTNIKRDNLTFEDKEQIVNSENVDATFSNWEKYKTDARVQVLNPDTNEYEWEIEDVSDANTPTINQVDIPVEVGETIQIKIRSLSEVGYPEAPIKSEFSETITIPFPENLESILNEDDFILNDATQDGTVTEILEELETRGLNLHLSSQIRDVDVYYAHSSEAIASGFKDENGNIINLYDYLLKLQNQLNGLREEINRSKGILEISLFYKNTKKRIYNLDDVTFNVEVEDYMEKTKVGIDSNPITLTDRTYRNNLIKITDFKLQIKNAAESTLLGLLSHRAYGNPSTAEPSTFAYNGADMALANRSQPLYVNDDGEPLYTPYNGSAILNNIPKIGTQKDHSWIWQQYKALDGTGLAMNAGYRDETDSDKLIFTNASFLTPFYFPSILLPAIQEKANIGITRDPSDLTGPGIDPTYKYYKLTDKDLWELKIPVDQAHITNTSGYEAFKSMASSVHITIPNLDNLTNTSVDKLYYLQSGDDNAEVLPITIYVKPFVASSNELSGGGTIDSVDIDNFTLDNHALSPIENHIKILGATNFLNADSKVILQGTGTNFDGKLLTIKSIGSDWYLPETKDSTAYGTSGKVAQIHICNKSTVANNTNALKVYNVYNNINIDSVVDSYMVINSGSVPKIHTKSLRLYIEDETKVRPTEFQLNFRIKQHKETSYTVSNYSPMTGVI